MAKSKKLSAGSLKDDDGKPIKAGESVFSDSIWQKLKVKEGAEATLKAKLKVKSDKAKKAPLKASEVLPVSRDVLEIGGIITFIDRTATDVTIAPDGASLIYEADWKNLLGDQKEADYIKALGLVVSG